MTSIFSGNCAVIQRHDSILSDVLESEQMQGFWKKYQTDFNYTSGISFEATIDVAKKIMTVLAM